jgi:hypothetical protein
MNIQSPRAVIRQDANEVVLQYNDECTGERAERRFWVAENGGYVYEISSSAGAHRTQVCGCLSTRGYTLEAKDAADLLRVIRAEWRAAQREEKAYQKRWGRA